MKNLRLVCGVVFLGVLGAGWIVAQAQQHHEDPAATVMEMGMMQGATHQAMMTPFLLPELQTDLGLSTQQVTLLRQMKQEMLSKGKDLSEQIAAKRKELDGLLGPGTSKGELVKKLFEEMGSLHGQQMYASYETANKMKAVLTEAQRGKLAGMKPGELHQTMMSHMSMNDKMEMMQFMDGDGMMMNGMMMGQGHMMTHEGMMGAPKQ